MCHVVEHLKPCHCRCCGKRILSEPGFEPTADLRQVRFNVSNGSYMELTFCHTCAASAWTHERITALKTQMDEAYALSLQGKGYRQHENGTWEIRRIGSPNPNAQTEMDQYRALRIEPVSYKGLTDAVVSVVH